MHRARFAVLFVLSFSAMASVRAQQETCHERIVPVSIANLQDVSVPVLDAINFQASLDSKPLQINSATQNQTPPRILLLLDSSGSQDSPFREQWEFTVNVADDVLVRMHPQIEIGLATFSGRIEQALSPTTDRKKLRNETGGLRSSRPYGQTALWDAIRDSAAFLKPSRTGDTILVVTDAGDNSSKIAPSDVAQILLAAGIRLFSVTILDAPSRGPSRADEGHNHLSEIVKETGGTELTVPFGWPFVTHELNDVDRSGKQPELRSFLNAQYRQIHFFYRLRVVVPPIDKPGKWKLEMTGIDKATNENMMFAYPQTLLPCK